MSCPYCRSRQTQKLHRMTNLGYAVFRCGRCQRKFNQRTGTPFNFLEFPTDIVFQVLLCRLRYKLSLRDLPELFLLRGFTFTHEAVREWEERFAPLMAEQLRRKRKGQVSRKWYVDETFIKVKGKCCDLYRAIDQDGNLVDSLLSEKRDMAAAQRFFRSALSMAGRRPERVTTDGLDSYPRAIREVLVARSSTGIIGFSIATSSVITAVSRSDTILRLRFSAFPSAQRFWRAFEEVRQYLRPRQKQNEIISLAQRRTQFITRVKVLES